MQAITALAHLHSTVLFFVDISEQCGYPIKQQVALYHSIKPLFANKPLLIVANKIDLKKFEDVAQDDRALLESISKDRNTSIIQMSNATEEGIVNVKTQACELLLAERYEKKIKGKRMESVVNRIHIATPTPRDDKDRPTSIPDGVLEEKKKEEKTKTK
jgi:nucleolar GTP-binding protein